MCLLLSLSLSFFVVGVIVVSVVIGVIAVVVVVVVVRVIFVVFRVCYRRCVLCVLLLSHHRCRRHRHRGWCCGCGCCVWLRFVGCGGVVVVEVGQLVGLVGVCVYRVHVFVKGGGGGGCGGGGVHGRGGVVVVVSSRAPMFDMPVIVDIVLGCVCFCCWRCAYL